MKRFLAAFGSLVVIGLFAAGSTAAVVTTQTGCGGSCTTRERGTCEDNYNMCTTTQGTLNTAGGCAQCAHVFCDCLNKCGDDCSESNYGKCQPVNGSSPTTSKDGG